MEGPPKAGGKRVPNADPPESAARAHGGRRHARVGARDTVEQASMGILRAGNAHAQHSALSAGQQAPDEGAKSVSEPEGAQGWQYDHAREGFRSAEKGAASAHEHTSDLTGRAEDCSTSAPQSKHIGVGVESVLLWFQQDLVSH